MLRGFERIESRAELVEVGGGELVLAQEVADQRGRTAAEEAVEEAARHGAPDCPARHGGTVDEGTAVFAVRHNALLGETREDGAHGGKREIAVERRVDIGDGGLAPVPEDLYHGKLERAELVSRHGRPTGFNYNCS